MQLTKAIEQHLDQIREIIAGHKFHYGFIRINYNVTEGKLLPDSLMVLPHPVSNEPTIIHESPLVHDFSQAQLITDLRELTSKFDTTPLTDNGSELESDMVMVVVGVGEFGQYPVAHLRVGTTLHAFGEDWESVDPIIHF